jgi:hypothetical protein
MDPFASEDDIGDQPHYVGKHPVVEFEIVQWIVEGRWVKSVPVYIQEQEWQD